MFTETYDATARTAAGKVQFLKKNPLGYWIMAMMAGIYIGIGVLLNFTIGGQLAGAPYTKNGDGPCVRGRAEFGGHCQRRTFHWE